MRVVRPHHMTRSDAKDWVESQLQGLLSQFGSSVSGATHTWRGDIMDFSFSVSLAGRIKGTIEVTETDFLMYVPLWILATDVRRQGTGGYRAVVRRKPALAGPR